MANPIKIYGADYLSVVQPAAIPDNTPFTIRVEALNPEGALDAAYVSANVDVEVKDSGDNLIHTVTIPMVNGVAEDTNVVIDLDPSPLTPFTIEAITTQTENVIKSVSNRDYSPIGESAGIPFGQNKLVFTVQPVASSAIERFNDQFTITVQAQDVTSTPINGATDLVTITLSNGDVLDTISDNGVPLFNFNLDGVTGSFTSSLITIAGGADTDLTEITVTATGYTAAVSNQFFIYDVLSSENPSAMEVITSSSSWTDSFISNPHFPGYTPEGALNWKSAWDSAHDPVANRVHSATATPGVAGTFTLPNIRYWFQQRNQDYGPNPGTGYSATMSRNSLKYDITSHKGSVLSAFVRINAASISGSTSIGNLTTRFINLYAIASDPTGASQFNRFNSMLTLAQSGTFAGKISVADAIADDTADGYFDIIVSASSINSSPDNSARYIMIIEDDFNDTEGTFIPLGSFTQSPDIEIGIDAVNNITLRIIK